MTYTIVIPDNLVCRLECVAARTGVSRYSVVLAAIRRYTDEMLDTESDGEHVCLDGVAYPLPKRVP